MVAPTGEQFEIGAGGYRAVVTEGGATLRALSYDGTDLVQGFGEHEMPSAGRGQLLVPWPNRIEDGSYRFGDRDLQLPVSEVPRHNAMHGLVRWAAWTLRDHSADRVSLCYRLMAQSGYPWLLDLRVDYEVADNGLTVTQSAVNRSDSPAPYAAGAHPYLLAGSGPVDDWELTVPARTRVLVSEDRLLPVGREDVGDTPYDFRVARRIGAVSFDHPFTDLEADVDGVFVVELHGDHDVRLWADTQHGWLQLYTGDDRTPPRTAIAVEPMTAPPNAFRTGEGLLTLEPGQAFVSRWGIAAR
jgi:aldose 1-epimerase